MWSVASGVAGASTTGQDRVLVFQGRERVVLVVADGAGGMSYGAEAADFLIEQARKSLASSEYQDWTVFLTHVDQRLAAERFMGLTTGLVVDISEARSMAAFVGDSRAWALGDHDPWELTAGSRRKPLLGSGVSRPKAASFGALRPGSVIAAGSDGLFKYVSLGEVGRVLDPENLARSTKLLLDLPRLRSGKLRDDVAVACVAKYLPEPKP